jgi:hypothetical protein
VKVISIIVLSLVSFALPQMTARDYYNELREAKALNGYTDEYVCFPDEPDAVNFAVVSKVESIAQRMRQHGRGHAGDIVEHGLGKHALVVQDYYKGIPHDPATYQPDQLGSDTDYSITYGKPLHGKSEYLFNWSTGRYRFLVYALDRNKNVPASEGSGKCELIHPEWATPEN